MFGISLAAHGAVAACLVLPWHLPAPLIPEPPQNAGETFELPAPEPAETPLANASPSPALGPDTKAAAPAPPVPDAPAHVAPPARGRPALRTSYEGRPSAGQATALKGDKPKPPARESSAAVFGAVGDRSATDLARAFTRDFPQAASGDPLWQHAPLGAAGDATLNLVLDETGHLENWSVTGNPSGALSQGIRRTMALIKGRPFVAQGKRTTLRLVATVTTDTVHDGLHGEVFAIGGSFHEGEGAAFFALNIGRRIDLRVRAQ